MPGHWNYRVVEDGEVFRICEIFYDSDDYPYGWSDAHAPEGDSIGEMFADAENQKNGMYEPYLHVQYNEDSDERLVAWREDGNYENQD